MPFNSKVKEEALVRARRSCCICGRFAGRNINVHHIMQEADGGENSIENAIVLCLDCHGQVGHYNPRHPIGNKYTADELRKHRDKWFEWCENNPHLPLVKHPIVITPCKFQLFTREWSHSTIVRVTNTSRVVYFDVYIVLKYDIPNIDTSKIKIEVFDFNNDNQLKIDNDYIVDTSVMMYELNNSYGYQKTIIKLSCLEPNYTAKIRVESTLKPKVALERSPNIYCEIAEFSDTPSINFSAEGKAGATFKVF